MVGLRAILAVVPPLLRAGTLAPASYDDLDDMYAAFSRQPHRSITLGGSTIDVSFADGAPGLDHDRVIAWVRTSATAMAVYFGRYPVDHYRLIARAQAGQLAPEDVWRQSVVGMPTGEPDAGGGGMDGTQAHNRPARSRFCASARSTTVTSIGSSMRPAFWTTSLTAASTEASTVASMPTIATPPAAAAVGSCSSRRL